MLEIQGVTVNYGAIQALSGVSLTVPSGTKTAILGANGAGKSSLLRAISGLTGGYGGKIRFDGQDLGPMSATERARLGIAHAMEGRRLFKQLTVQENLELAWSFGRRGTPLKSALDEVYGRFPILGERSRIACGLLSGGQQQMLILSCTTVRSPRLLLLDEPSLGLAPIIVTQIYEFIDEFARSSGVTVVLTEQMAMLALKASHHAVVLRRGTVALEGASAGFLERGASSELSAAYL
ncbi:ABC transporter ATP-binding protein [Caenimonas sp. SL110]|uniref:ABC transporter ATP-binding protein n=1 Tax=Caenimonas sp. SL110 TaxID=1450524 RepID=UPI000652E8AE|nr:ABC transporter ATP-binding protein [Caenimonas sp. SL110]